MVPGGLPHSDILGSLPASDFPRLFATCYVLHRLLAPRHSPRTLSSLTTTIFLLAQKHHSFDPTSARLSLPLPLLGCQRTIPAQSKTASIGWPPLSNGIYTTPFQRMQAKNSRNPTAHPHSPSTPPWIAASRTGPIGPTHPVLIRFICQNETKGRHLPPAAPCSYHPAPPDVTPELRPRPVGFVGQTRPFTHHRIHAERRPQQPAFPSPATCHSHSPACLPFLPFVKPFRHFSRKLPIQPTHDVEFEHWHTRTLKCLYVEMQALKEKKHAA